MRECHPSDVPHGKPDRLPCEDGVVTKRLVLPVLGVAIVALIGIALVGHFQTMPANAAAKALRLRFHVSYAFHCHRIHNDGTIALANVTYQCEPERNVWKAHPELTSYWISTDRHRITGIEPMG